MSNELKYFFDSGATLYALLRNDSFGVWNSETLAFEAWNDSNFSDYVISVSDQDGDAYLGNMPTVPAGRYWICYRLAESGTAALADKILGWQEITWDSGSEVFDVNQAELALAVKILKNKVVQNKLTGVMTVYDNDGQTALLTLTPSDDGENITLTPSTVS